MEASKEKPRTSTHTVTVEWNDNVSGLDVNALTWPSGKVDQFSLRALWARGINPPPRTFKAGDWVRFQGDMRKWSTGAYQVTTLGTDGRHRPNGLHGAWFPDQLKFVAEGEVPE